MKYAFLFLFLAAPLQAQTVKGIVTLTATASDVTEAVGDTECGIAFVQFYNGTTAIGPQITAPVSGDNYAFDWDTKSVPNGSYSITAKATDKAGADGSCDGSAPNIGTSNVLTIVVGNPDTTPPSVTITVDLHVTGTISVKENK